MSTSHKFLLFAAELAITCMLIGIFIAVINRGTDLFDEGSKQATSLERESAVGEFYAYDGEVLSGAEVKELYARYHLKKLKFEIATKESLANSGYFSEIIDGLDQTDEKFINEEGRFLVEVIEERGAVVGFRVTQQ